MDEIKFHFIYLVNDDTLSNRIYPGKLDIIIISKEGSI